MLIRAVGVHGPHVGDARALAEEHDLVAQRARRRTGGEGPGERRRDAGAVGPADPDAHRNGEGRVGGQRARWREAKSPLPVVAEPSRPLGDRQTQAAGDRRGDGDEVVADRVRIDRAVEDHGDRRSDRDALGAVGGDDCLPEDQRGRRRRRVCRAADAGAADGGRSRALLRSARAFPARLRRGHRQNPRRSPRQAKHY